MHLLECNDNDTYTLTYFPNDDEVPPYAILSHTWGAEGDEVSFEDLTDDTGKGKAGYEKIRLCGEQAKQDGLRYFWIDACCIDRSYIFDVQKAIESMFGWYRDAARCYVYLSDVSGLSLATDEESAPAPWESQFRQSRWFTRGWTLQELLAPPFVEFFSQEWVRLGDKPALNQMIHEITGIPEKALKGSELFQFSISERLSWNENRNTKLEEDEVYSLLGILGVRIPVLYGEGKEMASRSLQSEVDILENCIRDLRSTDPRDEKMRIEEANGGLVEDSCHCILQSLNFQQWRNASDSRLLWVRGDPGRGKTMLLCDASNELRKSLSHKDVVSWFFCQATDPRINNASAVLRGLLSLLIDQQPSIISHMRKRYFFEKKALFENGNAWFALSDILASILQDKSFNRIYLVVDALDECTVELPRLLDFISQTSSECSHVRWIVSSRSCPKIGESLETIVQKSRTTFDLDKQASSTAVRTFVQHNVLRLAQEAHYDNKIREAAQDYLSLKADGNFLWIALACQSLQNMPPDEFIAVLETLPSGIQSFYDRELKRICDLDEADFCKQVLAVATVAYRPLSLIELESLLAIPGMPLSTLKAIVGLCWPFLVLRENTIHFVHQASKDFLVANSFNHLFPLNKEHIHYAMFSMSLQIMSKTLRRDIYNLCTPGCTIDQVMPPDPDPLAPSRYSCVYWIDHLYDSRPASCVDFRDSLQDHGKVYKFIKETFLYWLEALSLCGRMLEAVVSIARLETLVTVIAKEGLICELIRDAHRFFTCHRQTIAYSPLQAYASALVFSPAKSLTRQNFEKEAPNWLKVTPALRDEWSPRLQSLKGHGKKVTCVAFSHDSKLLASGSEDITIKVWDIKSERCLHTLKGHSKSVTSVTFSQDGTRLASGSYGGTIKVWGTEEFNCLHTLEGHRGRISFLAFSSNAKQLVSVSDDKMVEIWDATSGEHQNKLSNSELTEPVAFSLETKLLISTSFNKVVMWDLSKKRHLRTSGASRDMISSVVISNDSKLLASTSAANTIHIRDTSNGACLRALEGHSNNIVSVVFSPDSKRLASASWDSTIRIWDTNSGECTQILKYDAISITFSHDGLQLATCSSSYDDSIKIWDISRDRHPKASQSHKQYIKCLTLSHDTKWLASGSCDRTIKIWDTSNGDCLQTLQGHKHTVMLVTFSHDKMRLASFSNDKTVKIWDLRNSECSHTFVVEETLSSISFDDTGSCIHTQSGRIEISPPLDPFTAPVTTLQHEQHQEGALSADGYWITFQSENALLLPWRYRSFCSTKLKDTIVVEIAGAEVWMCKIVHNESGKELGADMQRVTFSQ